MDDIYELLQEIRSCPEIYLGKPSLERLKVYVDGYTHHSSHADDNDCLNGFQQYVEDRYEQHTDHHWSSIIQFFNLNREKDAFYEFYTLFDEFIKSKQQSETLAVIIPSDIR